MIPSGKVAVISHDAGGAEILSSWLKLNNVSYTLAVAGPAELIFGRKLGKINNMPVKEAVSKSDWVLTGTSWASNLEYHSIGLAKKEKKFVASFLDHWVNYRERFAWHGPEILPDEIWVGDTDAHILAKKLFPKIATRKIPNAYWLDVKNQVDNLGASSNKDTIRILFASSNIDGIRDKQTDINFSDQDILNKFFVNIQHLFPRKTISRITILRHPSEKIDKYSNLVFDKNDLEIKFSENRDTALLLSEHTHVAGYESMLLVLAKICGKTTINVNMDNPRLSIINQKYIDLCIQ